MILPIASVVTKKTLSEFFLLKLSIEQYHQCIWYISCDLHVYNILYNYKNVNCFKMIDSDDADHNFGDDKQKENFMKIVMTKFDVTKIAIKEEGHILFLDSDMLFVNPIEEEISSLFTNKNIDAFISQHMTNNWEIEAKHGLFNVGMFHIKNLQFVEEWENLSKNYKKYNFYYEQQPLEYVQRNFTSLNLPINYNIGWWRFNNPSTQKRLDSLNIIENKIFFGKKSAINFHAHFLKDLKYENFGKFLIDKICVMLEDAENENYKKILENIRNKDGKFLQ